MKRWLKRITVVLVALMVTAGMGVGWMLHSMRQADERHAQFLGCGKSINNFLKTYAGHIDEAFQQTDAQPVVQHYSQDYASRGRGNWTLDAGTDIGDVDYFTLQAVGSADYNRNLLGDELAQYLGQLQSVDRVKCKINLIEQVQPGESAQLTVKYILDGKDGQGRLFQDRFFFALVGRVGNG